MFLDPLRIGASVTLVAVAAISGAAADRVALRRDAEQLKQKVAAIRNRSTVPSRRPVRTTISEREVNAYLTYELTQDLPVGVVEPSVSILGPNRVSGRAVVDLDRVRKEINPTSRLDPLYYLTGRLPVAATGVLTTSGGVGQFHFESADVGGVPIPKFLLQQIVSYYSRSPERPSGISLESAFPLPASIREIQVARGQAIVVQ
jgi:hypothetical protein